MSVDLDMPDFDPEPIDEDCAWSDVPVLRAIPADELVEVDEP